MSKKEEVKIPKKVREELTEQIIGELNTTVKNDIVNEVVDDVKKSFDVEFKNGIKNEIKSEIIDDIKKDISKEQKKLSRKKSFKIFRLYIYLLVLVALLLYILYRLYQTDNLTLIDKKFTRKTTSLNSGEVVTTTTTSPVKDGAYYIKNYGYLMDNIKIANVDLLKENIDIMSLSIGEKLAMAYLNIPSDKIVVEGIIHTFSEDELRNSYLSVFGSLDGYMQSNFLVQGLNYAYSNANQAYMAVGDETLNQGVVENMLVNGYQSDDMIVLEARAYVIKDNAVYNPINMNYRIIDVTEDMDLSKVQNRLLGVLYKFAKNGDDYNLVSITRK